jgi:hypothetical protein
MKKIELLAASGIIVLLSAVSPAAAPDGVAAVSAGDFLNSLGVCTHIGQGIDNPSQSAAALAYAGLRNIRDDGNPRHVQDWISVHEQAGVKVVLTWSGPGDSAISSLISTSKQLAGPSRLRGRSHRPTPRSSRLPGGKERSTNRSKAIPS